MADAPQLGEVGSALRERHNAEKYAESKAITTFKEFLGRSHFPGAPGREEVDDYALEWATKHAATHPAA